MVSSELVKLQLAWLDQGMDEYEAQARLQFYLEAGFEPELAAAVASAELHLDEVIELRERVEKLERTVVFLTRKLEQIAD